jgi:hypothetical protein
MCLEFEGKHRRGLASNKRSDRNTGIHNQIKAALNQKQLQIKAALNQGN